MKWPWLVFLALLSSGCSAFSEQQAQFVAWNSTPDNMRVVVNGKDMGSTVFGNTSWPFTVTLSVPRSSYDYGPSPIDKVIQVDVAVRNDRTGQLTTPITCQAGGKVTTNVTYEVQSGRYNVRCNTSQSY